MRRMDDLDATLNGSENPSIQLAHAVLDALIEQGVRWVAYCPGSRDAPFGYVLASLEERGRVRAATFSDERSAGFWAVGAAKAVGEPVAVITTSGTAVAELHPALEEAWFQSLPVIAVTADRPHEMRGVGASQTTHQAGIFGGSVVASAELPAEISYDVSALARVRGRVRRIVAAARGFLVQAGPVHLNVAFRDPLVPVSCERTRDPRAEGHATQNLMAPSSHALEHFGGDDQSPGSRVTGRADPPVGDANPVLFSSQRHPAWDEIVVPGLRTLVVAGDGASSDVAAAASSRGIPIVAEPSANVADLDTWIPYQQWVVPELMGWVEQVVVTGRPTLSRPITQLLGQPHIRKIIVATHPEWVDVHETADVVVSGMSDEFDRGGTAEATPLSTGRYVHSDLSSMIRPSGSAADSTPKGWLGTWHNAADAVDRALGDLGLMEFEDEVDDGGSLTLLSACRAIWRGNGTASLWLGASNTVRGFDLAANLPGRKDVYSNRGLAGIDGTVAAALGLAMVGDRPVRAVMGDMTFAYDLSTLAQRPEVSEEERPDLQVIVLDDGGGSIFASLEHAGAKPDVYERFFAVAPQVDPVAAAQACGWIAQRIETCVELRDALAAPIVGRSLLHVPIPRPAFQLDAARLVAAQAISKVTEASARG